ncbi:MAG: glycosyltransferase family 39 protein [Promethearchaeota archaeon]
MGLLDTIIRIFLFDQQSYDLLKEENLSEIAKIVALEIGIIIFTYLFFLVFVAETYLVNLFGLLSLVSFAISFIFALVTLNIARKSRIKIVSRKLLIFIYANVPVVFLPISIIFYLFLGDFLRTVLSILFPIILWTLFCNIQLSGKFLNKKRIMSRFPIIFTITVLVTSFLEYLLIVPSGVSGPDAATFYFMALRFAENPKLSSFYYEDPLIPVINELLNGESDLHFLAIPNAYVYDRTTGTVYTDKSIGAPLIFAISILLFGKNAALYVNVVFGFLTNLVTYFFAKEIFWQDKKRGQIAAISVLAIAFNPTHLIVSGYTMSDIISEFCVTTGIFSLLKAQKNENWLLFLVSGCSFGYAVLTRHTNVLIVVPVLLLLVIKKPKIIINWKLYSFLFSAVFIASPALIYHNMLFSTPLQSESWIHSAYYEFTLQRLIQEIIIHAENVVWNFGVLIPFALIGFYKLLKKDKPMSLFFLGCIIITFAPYAFYIYFGERHMLPVFPIFSALSGKGLQEVYQHIKEIPYGFVKKNVSTIILIIAIFSITVRYHPLLPNREWLNANPNWLTENKFEAIYQIKNATEEDSVILCGALATSLRIYAERYTIYITYQPRWYQSIEGKEAELVQIINWFLENDRDVFFLIDETKSTPRLMKYLIAFYQFELILSISNELEGWDYILYQIKHD